MKKLFLLLALIFSVPVAVSAQYDDDEVADGATEDVDEQDSNEDVVDGIVRKQHIKAKKPLMPAYVREANVLWSKTLWRIIDLRQKQNLYLYYPTQDIDERKSLARVLFDAVQDGEISAYSTSKDNEFEQKLTPLEAYNQLQRANGEEVTDPDSVVAVNPETGKEEIHYAIQTSAEDFTEIRQIKVKEVWFFDKRYGRMDVRILGLCPMSFIEKNGVKFAFELFWVYYPEAAGVLSRQEAYSYHNDAQRISLRDKLETRQFDSYIMRESNVYNNRVIASIAANGIDQNMEAQRIQADIFQHEHDMWEY